MSKVAEKKESNVVAFDASVFEEDAGIGLGQLGQEDVALPFLKVLSRQDPILDDLDNAKAGDIYNTVTGQVWKGKEGISVVPCVYQRRYIEWAPRGTGTGAPINIFTPDDDRPKTERSSEDNREYVVDGQGSYLEETHQHFVVIIGDDGSMETALIAMKSTQLKKSRKWNSMVQSRTMQGKNGMFTPPRFSHVYALKTVSEENSKGSWHGWEISLNGPVEDANIYQSAKAFATSILAGEVNVKHQDESADVNSDDIPF
jgi:hypothetical protein|tara:strand:- start:238 stop:1011 length:774 start_codon:yes stop_codon:yes gene_type:complete